MVSHFESFDHQPVDAANGQCIEDGQRSFTPLFTCHQYFAAGHAFWIGKCFFNNEETSQRNGEHRAQQTTERGDDECLHPLDAGPEVHDQQGRNGENDARSEGFTSRSHGLNCVVFKN